MNSLERFLETCEPVPDSKVSFAEFRERFLRTVPPGERWSRYALSHGLRDRFPLRRGGRNILYVHGLKFRTTADVPIDRVHYDGGYHYLTDAGRWERTTFADLLRRLRVIGCDDAAVRKALHAIRR